MSIVITAHASSGGYCFPLTWWHETLPFELPEETFLSHKPNIIEQLKKANLAQCRCKKSEPMMFFYVLGNQPGE